MENINKACFMCGAIESDGIILNGEKICKTCEEKIVKTRINDIDYDEYMDTLKIILFDEHAKA